MHFERRFTITCSHEFFYGELCKDLQIVPTAACMRLLKRFRMLYKQDASGSVSVSAQQQSGQATAIQVLPSFSFYLLVSSKAFYYYTSIPVPKNGETLLFSNSSSGDASLLPEASGIERPSPGLLHDAGRLFGIIRIALPAAYQAFTVNLQAASVAWRYYIVAPVTAGVLTIKDADLAIAFNRMDDSNRLPADNVYQALCTAYPDARIFSYVSQSEVPLLQHARKKIQLLRESNNEVLLDNLPNPSYHENGIKIINTMQ